MWRWQSMNWVHHLLPGKGEIEVGWRQRLGGRFLVDPQPDNLETIRSSPTSSAPPPSSTSSPTTSSSSTSTSSSTSSTKTSSASWSSTWPNCQRSDQQKLQAHGWIVNWRTRYMAMKSVWRKLSWPCSNGDPDIHDYLFVQPLMDDKLLRRNKSLMTLKVISGWL